MKDKDSKNLSSPNAFDDWDSLDKVIISADLYDREAKQPNYRREAEIIVRIAANLTKSSNKILQDLSDAALDLCDADSAGISFSEQLDDGEDVFRWRSLTGKMSPFLDTRVPRKFSPCGVVVDTRVAQLMRRPDRHFSCLSGLGLPFEEYLLVPFMQNNIIVGTVWVASHQVNKKFDREDLRVLSSLSALASAAYEANHARENAIKSEKLVKDILNSTAEGICGVSLDGKINFVNDASLALFGYDCADEMIGKNSHDLLHHTRGDGTRVRIDECPNFKEFKNGQTLYLEDELLWRKDGTSFFADYRATPLIVDGKSSGAVVTFIDTTNRRKAYEDKIKLEQEKNEATKREELERFKLQCIFEQAPIPLTMLEGPNHAFIFANETYRRYFLEDADYLGRPVGDVIPDTRNQGFIALLDQVFQTGERRVGKESKFLFHRGNGIKSQFYFNYVFEPIRCEKGLIKGILVVISDVTEQVMTRKKLEDAIASIEMERHKFMEIFDYASTSMAITRGPKHIFEHANQSYLNIFEGRKLVGKPLIEALPELKNQPYPALFDRVFSDGEVYIEREALAYLQRGPEGPLEEMYFDQKYSRLLDTNGKPYGVFVHAFDVTERVFARRKIQERESQLKQATEIAVEAQNELIKAKEIAEHANTAKSVFLANMSHEIRTPLGAVMGFVDLIKEENISRRTLEDYLSIIDRNSTQLLRIIDDILDLSKVEAGMMLIENINFSLIELLSDFTSLMGFRARDKGITFDLKARTELPDMVQSDPTRLRQILTNIVGNAIKFTEQGRVELDVSFSNGIVEFEVHDTGRGISKEQEQGLFQPFSQGDVSITRKFGGTGLGLVLTRRLSEALGGTFVLKESTIGKGSTFVAKVRVNMPQDAKMINALGFIPHAHVNSLHLKKLLGLRVLLVEDSPDNQALISILLKRTGATVDIAGDGAAGVASALKGQYDVVLMDMQMPVMDGITAVKTLREKGYQTPIVALTAHAMKEERERCLKAGFSDFLSKPIHRESIFNVLSQIHQKVLHA